MKANTKVYDASTKINTKVYDVSTKINTKVYDRVSEIHINLCDAINTSIFYRFFVFFLSLKNDDLDCLHLFFEYVKVQKVK